MDDFKIIARILAAIQAAGGQKVFNTALVDEKVVRAPAEKRDTLAVELQKSGYVDGLFIIDDINNAPTTVMWQYSHPKVTLSGLEYMKENSALQKALKEIRDDAISFATQTVGVVIANMAGR